MRTSGMLSFTESTVSTRQVTTQIFGGPATLSVQRDPSGTIKINASGSADMESLRKVMTHPVLNYLQGGSAWKTDILVQGKQVSGVFYSDLIGLSSDLPAPLFKQAETSLPLRLEKKILSAEQEPEQEMVSAQLGSVLDVKLWGTQKNESFDVKRGTVVFGKGADLPRRDGVWVSGTLPVLSLSGWEPLLGSGSATPVATPASNTQVPIRLAGIDLLIEKVGGYGYMADNLHINARNPKGLMLAQLSSEAINGELRWQPQGNGKLVARLKNLSPYKGNIKKPDEGMKGSEKNAQLDPIQKNRSTAFPALDVTIDSLILAGNNLGRFELVGEQRERDWQLERVRLTNADGVLSADGKWQMGEKEQTVLNARLDINNAGKILGRFGYPNTVRRGSGRLDGTFTWQGGPAAFSYAKLNGSLKVDTVKGQFLEIDPGFGKLLSILSLQALPRHASLDFADVFSKGFAFDNITGNGIIEGGILSTDDFKIIGSAAKVNMVGQVDLNRETQNLQVRVYPAVGNSVSLLGFVGGPAVGVGVFLANKLLRDPLDKLVSFEYNVSGSWAEPNVKKMDRN